MLEVAGSENLDFFDPEVHFFDFRKRWPRNPPKSTKKGLKRESKGRLGRSWGASGWSWGGLGAVLGRSWGVLGRLGAVLGPDCEKAASAHTFLATKMELKWS